MPVCTPAIRKRLPCAELLRRVFAVDAMSARAVWAP